MATVAEPIVEQLRQAGDNPDAIDRALKRHDRFYAYSDDPSVYSRGEREAREIAAFMASEESNEAQRAAYSRYCGAGAA